MNALTSLPAVVAGSNHTMERLSFDESHPYQAIEAAIHLNRYLLAKPFCEGRRVLDAACGEGYGSQWMMRWGATSVTGVDIDEGAVAAATRNFGAPNISFQVDDLCDLQNLFPRNSFDCIVSLETIEHLPDPAAFLRGIKHVATKDAIIIISCPNDYWYYKNNDNHNPFHLKKYHLDEFVALLQGVLGKPKKVLCGFPVAGYMNTTVLDEAPNASQMLMMQADDVKHWYQTAPDEALPASESSYFAAIYGATPVLKACAASGVVYPLTLTRNASGSQAEHIRQLQDEVRHWHGEYKKTAAMVVARSAPETETSADALESIQKIIHERLVWNEQLYEVSGSLETYKSEAAEALSGLEGRLAAVQDRVYQLQTTLAASANKAVAEQEVLQELIAESEARTGLLIRDKHADANSRLQALHERVSDFTDRLDSEASVRAHDTHMAIQALNEKLRTLIADGSQKEDERERRDDEKIQSLRSALKLLSDRLDEVETAKVEEVRSITKVLNDRISEVFQRLDALETARAEDARSVATMLSDHAHGVLQTVRQMEKEREEKAMQAIDEIQGKIAVVSEQLIATDAEKADARTAELLATVEAMKEEMAATYAAIEAMRKSQSDYERTARHQGLKVVALQAENARLKENIYHLMSASPSLPDVTSSVPTGEFEQWLRLKHWVRNNRLLAPVATPIYRIVRKMTGA